MSYEESGDAPERLYVLGESSLASGSKCTRSCHQLQSEDCVLLVGDLRQHEVGGPCHQFAEANVHACSHQVTPFKSGRPLQKDLYKG